jgi:hypothetical protein
MISCIEQPWAAIRCSTATKEEFIDMITIHMDRAVVLSKVKEQRHEFIDWDKDNPVIRISRCVLTETPGRLK